MKIFLGLDNTCGYYTHLERGLKALGVTCTLVNAFPNHRAYKTDQPFGNIGKIVEWLGKKRNSHIRGSLPRYAWTGLQGLSLLALLLSTLPYYDVFIFSGGTTFLPPFDLWLLKLFKKRIIVVYHGSDSRAPYISAVTVGTKGDFDVMRCISETRGIKKCLMRIERYADVIINNPLSSHLHEKKIINWHYIGAPVMTPDILNNDNNNTATSDQCVIVHAPTRPEPKGSAQIESAIISLKNKGYKIDFIKIVGRTNAEVLDALAGCDFVVDELFSDVLMAGFAAEAATFGKPAIVGMYEYEKVKAAIPDQSMVPPVLVCSPETVEEAIEKLIVDKEFRLALGRKARRFIEHQWSVEEVAKRFLLLAQGNIPQSWWFDPKKIDRLYGWGLTDQRAREVIRTIIKSEGGSALQLANGSNLEQAFVDFSKGTEKSC